MKCRSGSRRAAQIRERASPQAVALTGQRNGACRAQDGTLPRTTVPVSSVGFSGLMLMNMNVTRPEQVTFINAPLGLVGLLQGRGIKAARLF